MNERLDEARQPERDFAALIEDLFTGDKKVRARGDSFEITVKGESIELGNLSSGEKQLVLILLAAMGAGRSTIMIDEPELSMHPDWQQRLIGSVRTVNPDAQLILATHSPEVMALIPDKNIFQI